MHIGPVQGLHGQLNQSCKNPVQDLYGQSLKHSRACTVDRINLLRLHIGPVQGLYGQLNQ